MPSMSLLVLKNITKTFPGVRALDDVSLDLNQSEVLAILGENGAGKSTLIKLLGGVFQPDQGTIEFDGQETIIHTPKTAKEMRIGIIYQELNVIPFSTVLDNLFLGSERTIGFKKTSEEIAKAKVILEEFGISLPLDQRCSNLSVANQQLIEITKALLLDVRILVLDEPTTSLTDKDVDHLFEILEGLVEKGIGIIYISHRLEEIDRIANRLYFLRDGKHVGTFPKVGMTRDRMIELMVGRKLENEFPLFDPTPGDVVLSVDRLSYKDTVKDISFDLKAGEILGITGLMGAGRTEMIRLIAGADNHTSGNVYHSGKIAVIHSPADAIREGIGLLPEDRKAQGLVLKRPVGENFSLLNLKEYSSNGWISDKKLSNRLRFYKDKLSIKFSSQSQKSENLSGGNQQKLVLAKWLEKDCEIFIFDEPTKGIDVGAKYEIYELMNKLIEEGKSIIMVSSELPEVIGMSTRILVMKNGELVGELDNQEKRNQEEIMQIMV